MTLLSLYEHHSIVSDRRCTLGKPMLISPRAETGTVREEPFDDVVRGRETCLVRQQSPLYRDEILENARSKIGNWRYDFLSRNCEHFANWASGLDATSPQVENVLKGLKGIMIVLGVAMAVRALQKGSLNI